jgi:hypothetical protein
VDHFNDHEWCSTLEAHEFWKMLLLESNSFASHVHLHHPFTQPICTVDEVGRIFACMAGDPVVHVAAPLQVFVDGGRRPSYESEVLRRPPSEGERFEEWIHRMFGSTRYALFVNGAER